MTGKHKVLALDLARRTGWAFGRPGSRPSSGVEVFSETGREAVFDRAATWMAAMLAAYRPTTIVWEAPLPTSFLRGRTNSDTTALLFGLAAVVGLTAWREGFTDLRIATPAEVRVYFIGTNMRRAEAKAETKARCRALGWTYRDDNEADALALWAFMCSLLVPAAGPVPALPGIIRAAPPPRRRAAAEPGLFGGKHGP